MRLSSFFDNRWTATATSRPAGSIRCARLVTRRRCGVCRHLHYQIGITPPPGGSRFFFAIYRRLRLLRGAARSGSPICNSLKRRFLRWSSPRRPTGTPSCSSSARPQHPHEFRNRFSGNTPSNSVRVGIGFRLSFTTVDPLSLQSRVLCLIHRRRPRSDRSSLRICKPK
jgi:hypothetical protein